LNKGSGFAVGIAIGVAIGIAFGTQCKPREDAERP
jgi:hypothetical protein